MFFSHSLVLFLGVPSFGTCAQSQTCRTVADPDFLMRGGGGGGGGGSKKPGEMGGGGLSQKEVFSALWASVWSKNKVGGPSPGFATVGTYKLAPRGGAREKFWRRSRLRAIILTGNAASRCY